MSVRSLVWGAAIALAIAGCAADRASQPGVRAIPVTVTERGFEPSHIEVAKGENVELVFTRLTDATCATGAVFENGKKHDLPLDRPVRVAVSTDTSGTIAWACPMGMYRSTITVK